MTDAELPSLHVRDATDLVEIIAGHAGALEPIGRGSKRTIGRPVDAAPLDLAALSGIIDYEPAELVLSAHAATPLEEIERVLDGSAQRLAFEPPDFGALLGVPAGQSIGGVLAANLAGSRRIAAGAARDHFLGFSAVSGYGEPFRAGGRVVKNVTGYDLPKLLAGSWGTLAVLTEVTLRVAPRPETERTLLIPVAGIERAVELFRDALGSPYEVSAAAGDPVRGCALRLEGFAASVAARSDGLLRELGGPEAEVLEAADSAAFWRSVGAAEQFADLPVVWRVSVPPAEAAVTVAALAPERWSLDWGGGLIWAAYRQVDAHAVRAALLAGGHATLIKAPLAERRRVPVFQPQTGPLAEVTRRVKAALDPDARLNPGRLD